MTHGILLFYNDEEGSLRLEKRSALSEFHSALWCMPCRDARQEEQAFDLVHHRASHNYLINLSQNHSMSVRILERLS